MARGLEGWRARGLAVRFPCSLPPRLVALSKQARDGRKHDVRGQATPISQRRPSTLTEAGRANATLGLVWTALGGLASFMEHVGRDGLVRSKDSTLIDQDYQVGGKRRGVRKNRLAVRRLVEKGNSGYGHVGVPEMTLAE